MSTTKKSGFRFTLRKLFKRTKRSGTKRSGTKRSGTKHSGSKSNKDTSCIEEKSSIGGISHERWNLLFGDIKNCSAENLQKIKERKEQWESELPARREKFLAAKKIHRQQYGGTRRTKKHNHKRK